MRCRVSFPNQSYWLKESGNGQLEDDTSRLPQRQAKIYVFADHSSGAELEPNAQWALGNDAPPNKTILDVPLSARR